MKQTISEIKTRVIERFEYLIFDCPPNWSEFQSATFMCIFGFVFMLPWVNLFQASLTFQPLAELASSKVWGMFLSGLGFLHLVVIFLAGHKLRALLAFFSFLLWVFIACLFWLSPQQGRLLGALLYTGWAIVMLRSFVFLFYLAGKYQRLHEAK